MKNPLLYGMMSSLLFVASAVSQPQGSIDKDTDNLSATYAEYTAYLEIVTHGIKGDDRKELRSKFEKLKDECMFFALLLASEGRTKEMSVKVTNSRIEMAKKQMLKEIDNNYANLSILISKHQEAVLKLVQTPPPIVTEILQKKAKEVERKKG
jgi:hypothetical protein